MINKKDIERYNKQILAFRDIWMKHGLAPDSPMLRTFFNILLEKHSQRLGKLTLWLIIITCVLAVLTGLNIYLLIFPCQ